MSERRRRRRGGLRARSLAKRLVLAFLVTVVPLSLQGCALLGFLGSILSAVAPLLGPATQMIGAIAGAGGGGGGGSPIAAGGGGMNIPQRPASQSTFQPAGTGGGGGGQKPVTPVVPDPAQRSRSTNTAADGFIMVNNDARPAKIEPAVMGPKPGVSTVDVGTVA